jgi:hypothetical protein
MVRNIASATDDMATAKDQLSLSCHLNMASCCVKLGRWDGAVEHSTAALGISPDHAKQAKALFRRGQARRQLKAFDRPGRTCRPCRTSRRR